MNGWARHAVTLGCLLAGLASCPGWTQPVPGQRPGDSRPELPTFEPPAVQPGTVLPLVTPPVESGVGHPGETLLVREIRISGNTVLEPAVASHVPRTGAPRSVLTSPGTAIPIATRSATRSALVVSLKPSPSSGFPLVWGSSRDAAVGEDTH